MKKLLTLLVLMLLAGGAFYLYTQSGTPLDEPAPEVISEVEEMMEEAMKDPDMTEAEKMAMEEKMVKMMNPEESVEEENPAVRDFNKALEMTEEAMELMGSGEPEQVEKGEAMMAEAKTMSDAAMEELVSSGTTPPLEQMKAVGMQRMGFFTEIDALHKGSGRAVIYPNTDQGPTLRLEDFSVTRGPDLHVYLSQNASVTSASELGAYHDLGLLKSSKGNQNYSLPNDHERYKSVVIWCQAFGVLFSSAPLFEVTE